MLNGHRFAARGAGVLLSALGTAALAAGPSLAEREAAARTSALTHPACITVQPFHWSIGDATGTLAGATAGGTEPTASTVMAIASASKWLYAAFVAELRQGRLTQADIAALNFTSGYTAFGMCLRGQTVAECQAHRGLLIRNGGYVPAHAGKFFYSGGHMQKHATLTSMGLGSDDNLALAQRIAGRIGGGLQLSYTQPQLAGGAVTSAAQYGRFLQRIVAGELHIGALLGSHAVCTNPTTCDRAAETPTPASESLHYAVGHWVEDDPVVGDKAFSSAGAFGFYPWIDANKRWWGVLARHSTTGTRNADPSKRPGIQSMLCGRQIRAAWLKG